jgi:1,2-diacylglycerol 3-beta-galactosyltransferase
MECRWLEEQTTVKKRILFLMSDTGGGHRAAAEAIRDALFIRYGRDHVEAEMIDIFKESHFPIKYAPEIYPRWVNHGKSSYAMGFRLSDTRRRAAAISRTYYWTHARRFRKLFQSHPADVVVCVHSIVNRAVKRAYNAMEERPPFITVVTDLVSTHMFWFERTVERCLVPTQAAYDRGIEAGLAPHQLHITGLPVHPEFMERLGSKAEARAELGWRDDAPVILMVAGGDGMGRLYDTALALNAKHLNCQLAIIAGRNQNLKARLEAVAWNQPVHIYGFVTNMPRLMAAADVIVTKAGPATITEAAIAGLPMVLMDAIPGQEEGNVTYVIENEAGAYAPDPQLAADTVATWLAEGAEGLALRTSNARRIANPNAVWEIADEVWKWAHQSYVPGKTKRRPLRQLRNLRDLLPFRSKSS